MERNGCDDEGRLDHPGRARHPAHEVAAERSDIAWRLPDGRWANCLSAPPRGVLSGAFNPRHEGHVALRLAAQRWLGTPVGYELALSNADKPRIDLGAALSRADQFDDAPLALTRAATFAAKARLLPHSAFIAGADTALRIVEPRFYSGGTAGLHAALADIREAGCTFLVAARWHARRLLTLADVPVPAEFADLFDALPEREFRYDVSSTQLRLSLP